MQEHENEATCKNTKTKRYATKRKRNDMQENEKSNVNASRHTTKNEETNSDVHRDKYRANLAKPFRRCLLSAEIQKSITDARHQMPTTKRNRQKNHVKTKKVGNQIMSMK
jgi:ABC-type thiamine transport system substrate-binding protein